VMPGGRERSLVEFERLLAAADFQLTGSTATASDFHLMEGVAS